MKIKQTIRAILKVVVLSVLVFALGILFGFDQCMMPKTTTLTKTFMGWTDQKVEFDGAQLTFDGFGRLSKVSNVPGYGITAIVYGSDCTTFHQAISIRFEDGRSIVAHAGGFWLEKDGLMRPVTDVAMLDTAVSYKEVSANGQGRTWYIFSDGISAYWQPDDAKVHVFYTDKSSRVVEGREFSASWTANQLSGNLEVAAHINQYQGCN